MHEFLIAKSNQNFFRSRTFNLGNHTKTFYYLDLDVTPEGTTVKVPIIVLGGRLVFMIN